MVKDYIAQLTGIRIFLTLMVVVSDMVLWADVDPGFVQNTDWFFLKIFASAPIRVDVFFMLTGFLLFYIYKKEFSDTISFNSYVKFIIIRLARIYPVHLLMLFVIFCFYLLPIWEFVNHFSTQRITADGNWLLNILLLNSWGLGDHLASWNGPSWSISIEFLNYLVFPIFVLLIIQLKKLWHNIALLFGILLFYEYLQFTVIQEIGAYNGAPAMVRGLTGMALGMVLAQIYISGRLSHRWLWDYLTVCLLCVMGIIMSLKTLYNVPNDYLFYIPLPFLVMAIASSQSFIKRIFSLPFLVYLGNLSFGVYMLHQPVCRLFYFLFHDYYTSLRIENNSTFIIINLIVILITMIVFSAIIHKYIETPLRIRIKNWSKRKFEKSS
jgi:peptidoglycan/LPS O-acetylase OafA/YrhL